MSRSRFSLTYSFGGSNPSSSVARLFILVFFFASCSDDIFVVNRVSFKEDAHKLLSLFIFDNQHDLDPQKNVIMFSADSINQTEIVVLIYNDDISIGDFNNCDRHYRDLAQINGFKIYVDGNARDLFVKYKIFGFEKDTLNCEDVPIMFYDGKTWEIHLVDSKITECYYMRTSPKDSVKNSVIKLDPI